MRQVIESGKLGSNGSFTDRCQRLLEELLSAQKVLITSSCTDALEACAILLQIEPGDEVIVPSYTYTTTANAFALRGAKIVFADSRSDHPGIDERSVEALITSRTKAIVAMHYAGIACDMDVLTELGRNHGIPVVEDAALSIGANYKGQSLGTIGALGTISFHETKNITCGEGGALLVNHEGLANRAEQVIEKGTNRMSFLRGEVGSYEWTDLGSSYQPSEITAAFLWAQLNDTEQVTNARREVWTRYDSIFADLRKQEVELPNIPEYAGHNGHAYYLVTRSEKEMQSLRQTLHSRGIEAKQHYTLLHQSAFQKERKDLSVLTNAEKYSKRLLRLPMHTALTELQQTFVAEVIYGFYGQN